MLDDEAQLQLAKRMRPILAAKGVRVVFVGSTAIVALHLFARTSKDADALAHPELGVTEARRILEQIAEEEELVLQDKGWGTLALAKLDEDEETIWTVDLLVPEGGIIPEAAAVSIHAEAVETEIGPTAIAEHVLAMKAVAYGDCVRQGRRKAAQRYEADLLELKGALPGEIQWAAVDRLLRAFPTVRATDAAAKIEEVFGVDLGFAKDRDPAIG